MGELLGGDLGIVLGEHKTAVGGKSHKQGLAECFGGGVAASADVVHTISFSIVFESQNSHCFVLLFYSLWHIEHRHTEQYLLHLTK